MKQLISLDSDPVVGFLTADDRRNSYYLDENANKYIYAHDRYRDTSLGCCFFSTDLRAEQINDVEEKIDEFQKTSWNNQLGDLVVFSHENALNDKVKFNIEVLCQYAKNNSYSSFFFEDII